MTRHNAISGSTPVTCRRQYLVEAQPVDQLEREPRRSAGEDAGVENARDAG